ncbi:MAG: hypothetical protein HQL52_01150 [Magnetococcales bacterium]|nr:hypothetical protein [Magnetococcales bacterium]
MPNADEKPNPLFTTFGRVVDGFFQAESNIGDPIRVIPTKPGHGHLEKQTDPKDIQRTQEVVDHLRRNLADELNLSKIKNRAEPSQEAPPSPIPSKAAPDPQTEGATHFHLITFRKALQTGDERLLTGNPFYELTRLVFRHNLTAANNLFDHLVGKLSRRKPGIVPLARHYRDIWFGPRRKPGIAARVLETLGKWLVAGRLPLALLLFFGSSITTARGVNDLLQLSIISQQLGGLFDGSQAEMTRYLLSISAGLLLSSAILDFKGRIFHAMAEAGQVLGGIRDAFLRSPRWMVLATLLTLVSIKTNYDGIVSIISKQGDLTQQSQLISERVRAALGHPRHRHPDQPTSLRDLGASLVQTTRQAREKFRLVPEDEVKGVASSNDARKGPRYWGKHFIVHGGFEAGVNDVILTYNNHALSQNITRMLKESDLELRASIFDKITALEERYTHHLAETEAIIEADLNRLNTMMHMGDYSLGEINRVFTLEHYQINDIVATMVIRLEANKQIFAEVAEALNHLIASHVALLKQVDKAGAAHFNNYDIDAHLTIPEIAAIDALRKGQIPAATHKSFEELKQFLVEAYGLALAGMMLTLIFILSISMDLADPLVYGRWAAHQGKRDRKSLKILLEKLKEWESQLIRNAANFFDQGDVRQILKGITCPNETGLRNAFFHCIEQIDPDLKEPDDRSFLENGWYWIRGLFRAPRINGMQGYNDRARAIHLFFKRREHFYPLFIQHVFPGLRFDQGLGQNTFLSLFEKIILGQKINRESFLLELQQVREQVHHFADDPLDDDLEEQKALKKTLEKLSKRIKKPGQESSPDSKNGFTYSGHQELGDSLKASRQAVEKKLQNAETANQLTPSDLTAYALFEEQKPDSSSHHKKVYHFFYPIFFRPIILPAASFSHTRRNWLKELAFLDKHSLENLEALYSFIPELKETLLTTLPKLKKELLNPLSDICTRFPETCRQKGINELQGVQVRVKEIESESLEMWVITQLMGDESLIYSRVCSVELDEFSSLVRKEGDQSCVFSDRINALLDQAQEMSVRARKMESAIIQEMEELLGDIDQFCQETTQMVLRTNMMGWNLHKTQSHSPATWQAYQEQKAILEQSAKEAEMVLKRKEQVLQSASPQTEENLHLLKNLKLESFILLDRAKNALTTIQAHLGSQFGV